MALLHYLPGKVQHVNVMVLPGLARPEIKLHIAEIEMNFTGLRLMCPEKRASGSVFLMFISLQIYG